MSEREWMKNFNESWYDKVKETYLWNFSKEIVEKVKEWQDSNPESIKTHSCGVTSIELYDEPETNILLEEFVPNVCEIDLSIIVETCVEHKKANKIINLLHKLEPLDKNCSEKENCRCYFCIL